MAPVRAGGLGKGVRGGCGPPDALCWYPPERGEFLALDLGGTNFRVLVVRVAEDSIRMASEIYVIPTSIVQGTGVAVRLRICGQGQGKGVGIASSLTTHRPGMGLGEPLWHHPSLGPADHGSSPQLFNHIIDCIMDFQLKQDLMEQILPLGFTFSFPCQQLGLDKVRGWLQTLRMGRAPGCKAAAQPLLLSPLQAVLLNWTKGFNASGCVGQDVVQLLRDAAQRKEVGKGLDTVICPQGVTLYPGSATKPHMSPSLVWQHFALNVVAVVNDTVGTMMSCGYDDPKCEIGLIVGEEHCCTQGSPISSSPPQPV